MIDPHAHHHHARTTTDHPDPAAKPTDAAVHDEHARHGGHEAHADHGAHADHEWASVSGMGERARLLAGLLSTIGGDA